MFRGITVMVDGKMCVSVSGDELMCRIDPEIYDVAIKKKGVRPMVSESQPQAKKEMIFDERAGQRGRCRSHNLVVRLSRCGERSSLSRPHPKAIRTR
jgi:hypothetical protein